MKKKDQISEKLTEIIALRCKKATRKEIKKAVEDIFNMPFENISEIMIKWIAENHHPHTMVALNSTQAVIWESVRGHGNNDYLVD